jgi:predicted nucleic acid-binding protein
VPGRRAPYGGATFIADTSAWSRAHHARVRGQWSRALLGSQIATCPIVDLELLYSTRNGDDFDRLASDLAQLRTVPVTRSVTNASQQALRTLAHRAPLHHRSVKLPGLLVAACAADANVGVLHYDEDFDRLAEVLEFESRWIAPRGSID